MFEEHRVEPREHLELPIKLGDGSHAMTRDISPTGLFFEMDGERAIAGLVDFEMHLREAGMKFTSVGVIVRVEHRAGKTGVAVRLMTPRLDVLDDAKTGTDGV